jgi:3-oxoacyl-(acyl-carrier-protein) synthase
MGELFDRMPPYSSTKSFTGHTLGAAGAVEAIYSILGIVHSELFPSLNVREPINGPENAPVSEWKGGHNLNYVLSNSFGFGGNCTSLVFASVN